MGSGHPRRPETVGIVPSLKNEMVLRYSYPLRPSPLPLPLQIPKQSMQQQHHSEGQQRSLYCQAPVLAFTFSWRRLTSEISG